MKRIIIGIFVLIFYACSVNTSKEIDLEKVTFSYRDDAYVFFRNMRQTNYDMEVLEEAGWRIYRHDDYPVDTSLNEFRIALVVNWKVSKAYPIIEIPHTLVKEKLQITWRDPLSNELGTLALGSLRRNEEMEFLTRIYNHIMKENELFWNPNGKKGTPLFGNPNQKETFRVTMYDFYRLTGLL